MDNKIKWFIATTYSGDEDSVQQALERKRETLNMTRLHRVLVPTYVDFVKDKQGQYKLDKNNQKKQKTYKRYPGYIFLEMEVVPSKDSKKYEMDTDDWFNIRNTQNVTGLLGSHGQGSKPEPVPQREMDKILKELGLFEAPKIDLNAGDTVEITSGAFKGQIGTVSAINLEKEIAVVRVDMFGRATPNELKFDEFKKIN